MATWAATGTGAKRRRYTTNPTTTAISASFQRGEQIGSFSYASEKKF